MAKQITLDEELIRQEIMKVIEKYGKLPTDFRFDPDVFDLNKALGVNKTVQLLYDGKKDKRTIIDKTISAPFQEIRKFGESKEKSEIEGEKNWHNKLIYGDNLQALKYLLDNGYKEQIKLIYIDPPFATKSDFVKGETKAYRDKLEGAEFIEFLRERLLLMKELLSKEGSIFVNLDDKKSHYIKIILDEIFTEANFRNDIIWHFDYGARPKTEYGHKHNNIFWYSKTKDYDFKLKQVLVPYESKMTEWRYTKGGQKGKPMPEGKIPSDVWNIKVNSMSKEHDIEYPTRKPEELLLKIIKTVSDKEEDIILDAFAGSGTTCAVAEKLNRRWIGIDAGKLAIYTTQKRMLDIKNHKSFIVMNSGVYEIRDLDKQVDIDDELYKSFACDLFQVDKNKTEKINGVEFSGKYGNNYVYVFSNKGKITRQDLENLEKKLSGKLKRVYIIISQNQDKLYTNYLKIKNTQFYIHKIPYSLIVQFVIENRDSSQIIKHLRNNVILKVNRGNLKNKTDEKAPEIDQEALKKINKISQVKKKSDIETKFSNIAGFDFVNTFEIEIEEKTKKTKEGIEIKIDSVKIGEKNGIENLSMILVDKDYNQKSFKVSQTFFAEDDTEEDEEGNEIKIEGFIKTKKIIISKDGLGNEIAVIYMDDFGNELFKQFTI
ncbi:MAG: site-specific DNA-methyltransferase [Elusimicrobiota bacterium]